MILADEAATAALGRAIAGLLRPGDVVALEGPLGVGKTALARAILAGAGHDGEVPSPTFAIVQPYEHLPLPIWHADLYRLEDPDELEELGLDSALEDGALLVEWPSRAGSGAWRQALRLSLAFGEGGARRLTAEPPASWEDRWPPR
ncbi:tRNA (adenosine(37)-N6)-threonylcarbamoyltransferase complex ATPase subunit type 1 TsaE [Sphingomonas ginkgonis]|uniref:tRNA threonylcarbamoyladenosine biosynthesis protein TsaE n=1 Tax=Sphingomonas ginkgonis TaxID=2315330 RepID=A0A3R9WQC2_9SPHN|nr:tRNA (adenosine(37)-N6)-threonylcarbamoyltransferase complex ATPase subunit type 1 TsaE [Sphingomonas ginkgonis]RST30847.1 tRNA (adenosine(37)-N6)-threonylcarbamoyltransferase complex ATPase subunit type 1 TsaE [Sphingomonas ginkgonis]